MTLEISVFFIAVKQHSISFLLVCYQRFISLLVKNLLKSNALALFTSCVIRRIFKIAEIEYRIRLKKENI